MSLLPQALPQSSYVDVLLKAVERPSYPNPNPNPNHNSKLPIALTYQLQDTFTHLSSPHSPQALPQSSYVDVLFKAVERPDASIRG